MARPKRGSVQKLGRGRFRIWYYDADGKRCSEAFHGTERAAYGRLEELQVEPPEAPTDEEPHLTLTAFYETVYHPSILKKGLAPRTIEGYESQWNVAKPVFGDCDMDALTARTIEARIQELPTAGKQQAAFKIMRQLYTYAYRLEYVRENPMARKIERSRHFNYYRRDVYSSDEVYAVLEAAAGFEYANAVYLCLLGGLRRSEALGLVWGDLERVDGGVIVHVSRTWQRRRGTLGEEAPTKTGRSVRSVIIPAPWCESLSPEGREPSQGVVAEPRPNPDRVTRAWKRYCDDHDIRYVSLQGLRATYSTLLASAGVSDALVSDSMGHSVLQTRYKHYLNASQDARTHVANALRDVIQDSTRNAP